MVQATTGAIEPFASAAEVRAAHLKLMSEARQGADAATLKPRVDAFLQRAHSTGALLREDADREVAQAAIDYWSAWLLTKTLFDDTASGSFVLAEYDPVPLLRGEAARICSEAGLALQPEALERLVIEAATDSSPLALLRFMLEKLNRQQEADQPATESDVAGPAVDAALEQAAETAFNTLGAPDQATARTLLLELVEDVGENAHVRRRVSRETLSKVGDGKRLDEILMPFVDAGLILRTPGDEPDQDRYQIAFDALLHGWPRLLGWLNERRQRAGTVGKLIGTARLWKESGRKSGYLLTGGALTEALQYPEADPDLTDLVVASQRRGQRWTQFLWATVVVLVALLTAAVWNWREADRKGKELEIAIRDEKTAREVADAAVGATRIEIENAMRARDEAITIIADLRAQLADLQQRLDAVDATPPEAETEVVSDDVAQAYSTFQGDVGGSSLVIGREGFIWIGTDNASNLRAASSGAIVPAAEATTASDYVIDKNLMLRDAPPVKGSPAPASGVLVAGTRVKAISDVITVQSSSGPVQFWLPVAISQPELPTSATTETTTVYVQFATATRDAIERFSEALREFGHTIPGEERLDSALGKNEVRYFYDEDRPAAERLAANVMKTASSLGYRLSSDTQVHNLAGYKGKKPPPGLLELWIDLPG